MAVHDMNLVNQTGASFRSDLNDALAALVSNSSSTVEPPTKFPLQFWADTSAFKLKIRNAANTAWIEVGALDTANLGLALATHDHVLLYAALAHNHNGAHAILGANTFTAQQTLTGVAAINEARGSIAMHATTMNPWAGPDVQDGTGVAATITAMIAAPQPGVRRTVLPIAGSVITHGAIFSVTGNVSRTALAGERWEFEAITTTAFNVYVTKKDGTAVVSPPSGVTTFNTRAGPVTLSSSDVTTALAYTPSPNTHNHAGTYIPVGGAVSTDVGHDNVGSFCWVREATNTNNGLTAGTTYAAGVLLAAGIVANDTGGLSFAAGQAISGTWRAFGTTQPIAGGIGTATLAQRIA